MALLACCKMLFVAEKKGGGRGEINKNVRADFKLQLCSSYICIWSPGSPIQTWTWHLGFLPWPWSCLMAMDSLGCVSRPNLDLPPSILARRSCMPHHRRGSPSLVELLAITAPFGLWSVSALTPCQKASEILTNLPEILLLKTKETQGRRIRIMMWHSS